MQLQKKEFLYRFVNELISNSIREEKRKTEEEYYEELKDTIDNERISLQKIKELEINIPQKRILPPHAIRVNAPEASVIPTRPVFASPFEKKTEIQGIDLGKLNPVILDPTVRAIECPGAGRSVLVEGAGGKKKSKIKLNEEEIDSIINEFSEKTKIPAIRGIFKAVLGNLMIYAVISELAGLSFIIRKIQRQMRAPREIHGQISRRPGFSRRLSP